MAARAAGGHLPPGLRLDKQSGLITGTPAKVGSYPFKVKVTNRSGTATAPESITVGRAARLAVSAAKPPRATVGQPYLTTLAARGRLGALTWAVTKGTGPAGLRLDATSGDITGTPARAGTAHFTVSARDQSSPVKVATASESITVVRASAPLTITTTSVPKGAAGDDYGAQLTSTGGKAPTQWSIKSGFLPNGLSLDAGTGLISGTTTTPGSYQFTAQVTDGRKPTPRRASATLSITVAAGPALAISTKSVFHGAQGVFYSSTIQATGGVGPYEWAVTSGTLPAGLTLDPNLGQITGFPTGTGRSTFKVSVFDAAGNAATRTYTTKVARVPLTVSRAVAPATAGSYYIADVKPSGGEAPYKWKLIKGKPPAGLKFAAASGAIVGTPASRGNFRLTIVVTDSSTPAQRVTRTITLHVAAAPRLTVSRRNPPAGAVGVFYITGIGFFGGHGPYKWKVTAGKLPPGLNISRGSGMIVGTPTRRGKFRLTVRVTDSPKPVHRTAKASFTIVIGRTPRLAVLKAGLPRAVQGSGYAGTLQATGGVPPYNWTVPGSLPAGLFLEPLSGTILGTPTGSGTRSFTVTVTDSASRPVTARLRVTLRIDPSSPLSVATTELGDAVTGSFYGNLLTADGGVAPYTWTLARGKLPAGLTLGSDGGISGTPTGLGSFTFTVKVKDAATPKSRTATEQLTLNVQAVP